MKKLTALLIALSTVYFAALFAVMPDRDASGIENRKLKGAPSLTFESYKSGSFADDFEEYISDQFPFRDEFIIAYQGLTARKTKSGEFDVQIIEGKNDHNFYIYDENLILSVYTLAKDKNTAYDWAKKINEISALGKEAGFSLLVNFVPSKSEALSEMLPPNFSADRDEAIINLIRHETEGEAVFIDTVGEFRKQPLDELRSRYFNTDHHWNLKGAFEALKIMADTLRMEFSLSAELGGYNFKEYPIEQDYILGSYNRMMGDAYPKTESIAYFLPSDTEAFKNLELFDEKGKKLLLSDYLMTLTEGEWMSYATLTCEDYPYLHFQNTAAANDKSICVIKDSYFNAMLPNLTLLFKDVYVVDPRYYEGFVLGDFVKKHKIDYICLFYNTASLLKVDEMLSFKVK